MQDIIDSIAADIGIAPDVAQKATSMLVAFIAREVPSQYVDQIRGHVPGFDEMVATGETETAAMEAAPGGSGGLFGGGLMGAIGGLLGGSEGGLGGAMALLGRLEQSGLDLGQVKQLASGLVGHFRRLAGDEVVDRLLAEVPGAGHLIG